MFGRVGQLEKMILIVDDSPTDIELTSMALEATGRAIRVRSAMDGQSALAMLKDELEVPTLVLLDLKMPGMDGIEVLRKIRAENRLKEIPVVVVTSSSLESDRAAAIAAGASGYLQKHLAWDKFSKDLESIVHSWMPN